MVGIATSPIMDFDELILASVCPVSMTFSAEAKAAHGKSVDKRMAKS